MNGTPDKRATGGAPRKIKTAKTQRLQERWGANAGAQSCALPRPTFLRQRDFSKRPKREDDGREGAISGRLARKATGVSPSFFVHTGVFAESVPRYYWDDQQEMQEIQEMQERAASARQTTLRFIRHPAGASPIS